MDILKARQRAKEAKAAKAEAKAAGAKAAEDARQAELESDLERTSTASSAPSAPSAPAAPPAPRMPRASSTASSESSSESRARATVKVDPLQEFLAVYDDGDFEVAADDGVEMEPVLEDERRFLSFDLAGEAYAASIMDIREILTVVTLTEVPRAPNEVLGVLSKRGLVMPVCDLAAILGLRDPERALQREQRVLVVGDGERVCGLRVDRVRQVVRLAQRAIEDVPPGLGNKNGHMLLGLGRARVEGSDQPQMLILLDVPAVLAHFAETMGIAPAKDVAGGAR